MREFITPNTALVLVDLQHDFLDGPSSGRIVAAAKALLQRCRNQQIPVVHVWTTVDQAGDMRMPHWKSAGKWICVEGTPGHASPLPPAPDETVIHKRFFSAFAGTGLAELLAQWGISNILLAGVQTQSCIRATAVDAYAHGLTVEIAEAAVGSDDPLHAAISRRWMETRIARFIPESQPVRSVAKATAAARAAWESWRQQAPETRLQVVRDLAERVDVAVLAGLIAEAARKPAAYARAEAERSVALVRAASRTEVLELPCGARSRLRYVPLGVVAAITPWNNPAAIAFGKIAPALAYGNTVVLKPSPLAGAVADYLASLVEPLGLVQVVHGGAAVACQLMEDPLIDAVTLTGSEQAGFAARVICAQRAIPLQAELGGNNAAIVLEDADLSAAAAAIAEGAFGFSGQRCTANRRVIITRSIMPEFLSRLQSHLDPLGPLISREQQQQVAALVKRSGGVILQGEPSADPDSYPATVILCEDPSSEIVQEETFGPVLVVQPAEDFEHALQLCNGVRQGLAAALFSRCPSHKARFLDQACAGILKLNLTTADADAEAPFGGWKASGIGPAEHGRSNREFYTRTQAVYS
jgi:alpha-ketoglutaric semialdehyde dehydrogenase